VESVKQKLFYTEREVVILNKQKLNYEERKNLMLNKQIMKSANRKYLYSIKGNWILQRLSKGYLKKLTPMCRDE
jgi:hypothetical protein